MRAFPQLRRMTLATKWMPARKFRAVFSYRVAIARNSLSLHTKFSMRWRALYSSLSNVRGVLRLLLGGITGVLPAARRGSTTRSSASKLYRPAEYRLSSVGDTTRDLHDRAPHSGAR